MPPTTDKSRLQPFTPQPSDDSLLSARYRTIDKLPSESPALESTNFAFRSVLKGITRDFHKATKPTDSYCSSILYRIYSIFYREARAFVPELVVARPPYVPHARSH